MYGVTERFREFIGVGIEKRESEKVEVAAMVEDLRAPPKEFVLQIHYC